jgi:hypothetical protein
MKKTTLIIAILLLFAPFLKAQTTDITNGKARIYLLRNTGVYGWAVKFDFMVNNKKLCSLGNKKYTILDIDTGEVTIQTLKLKKNGENVKFDVPLKTTLHAGNTYYFNLYFNIKQGWEQITIKEVAEEMIKKLQITTCN